MRERQTRSVYMKGHTMEKYLKFFYELASIPHGSGNTAKIADYLVAFAQKRGLAVERDSFDNVIIMKPASTSYVNHEPVILQGHLDMVAVKEADSMKDLQNEGLDLFTDGDLLGAAGTSLGGDDGIAVAYMMDILDSDYEHPDLICIITADEETGMFGANGINLDGIPAKRLINIDNEEEGKFIVGCAGGVDATVTFTPNKEIGEGIVYEVEVSGLLGGHSGIDIDKQRGNANKILAEELCKLHDELGINLIEFNGGSRSNVIPNYAFARIMLTDRKDNSIFEKKIMSLNGSEYYFGDIDSPDCAVLSVRESGRSQMIIFDDLSTERFLRFLRDVQNGVKSYVENVSPAQVRTSSNLGVVKCDDDNAKAECLVRSSSEDEKNELLYEIFNLAMECDAEGSAQGDYPGWEYAPNSQLRDTMVKVYINTMKRFEDSMDGEMFKKLCKPEIEVIHAGLECGILSKKISGLDCVSFGPSITDIHTVNERMSLSSAGRMFEFLKELLKEL